MKNEGPNSLKAATIGAQNAAAAFEDKYTPEEKQRFGSIFHFDDAQKEEVLAQFPIEEQQRFNEYQADAKQVEGVFRAFVAQVKRAPLPCTSESVVTAASQDNQSAQGSTRFKK
ncbi:MAG: hypothetical protein AB7V32_04435 [Candidatus Berkiella sp.]